LFSFLLVLFLFNLFSLDHGSAKEARYNFQSYISVDRHVARSGVETVEELCEAFGSTRSVEEEDKEDENEQEMAQSFAETYKALQKVKAFSMCKVEATRTVKTL
jgi:predicted site-specific integrase-resolvase